MENEAREQLEVLTGTIGAVAAAVREIVMDLPPDSPLRTKLQTARDLQSGAMRELGRSEIVLFACERAWEKMLPE